MSRFVVGATWEDVPHLSPKKKAALWASIPPHARAARTRGIPALGAGAIYPFDESEYRVNPIDIPKYWPRAFALDAQHTVKSHLFGAFDRDSGTLYITNEFKRKMASPADQAASIQTAFPWIRGVGDCAALVEDSSRMQYIDKYKALGLNIELPRKGNIEVGIDRVYQMFSGGLLKVFKSCGRFFEEIRIYQRDQRGKVKKRHDHLMDCLRYLVTSLTEHSDRFITEPQKEEQEVPPSRWDDSTTQWMGS